MSARVRMKMVHTRVVTIPGLHPSVAAALRKRNRFLMAQRLFLRNFRLPTILIRIKKIAYPSITVFDFDIVEKRHKDDDNGGEPPIGGGVPSDLLTEDEGLPFD